MSKGSSDSLKPEFFAAANSGKGFVSFYSEIFGDRSIERRYLIKGGPGTGKSTFMKTLAQRAQENGLCVEYYKWHQEPWEKSLLTSDGNKINKLVGRNKDTLEYNHVVSENIALYAQWEKIYTFTFAYASGMNQKYFTMQGIHNQWFW